jgi:hypothetical protein
MARTDKAMSADTIVFMTVPPLLPAVRTTYVAHRRTRVDPDLAFLLAAARELDLPQWRIVAGCLYQTVWNVLTHRPARTGIREYVR